MNQNDTQVQSPADNGNIVEIKDLIVHYITDEGVVEAVNDLSLSIKHGETLGLVGETGAGKTTIALSIMGLLPDPPSKILQGSIHFDGEDLLKKTQKEMRQIRGEKISMIFQDPMTALNPVFTVGDQIREVIELHQGVNKKEAAEKAKEIMLTVGIDPSRYHDYPHQFSGGMKQRVVIAIALACRPELLIADEPTTALDVTIQAQMLELMMNLKKELNTSMIMITHDLGVIAEVCDRCAVIYAGEIVESGTLEDIFENPKHPYTIGLFDSLPDLDHDVERLKPIKGLMPNPMELPPYCSFADRCDECTEECKKYAPRLEEIEPGHAVRCIKYTSGKAVE